MKLEKIVDLDRYPIAEPSFQSSCKAEFDETGALVMHGFVRAEIIRAIRDEGEARREKVYAKTERHSVYLAPTDPDFDLHHARNRVVTSSKGCLTDDLIPENSALRSLYNNSIFRDFLCQVLGEKALHAYADPLSSINLHFHEKGQELGWHFDNSSFAITLMVQKSESGGQFEYVSAVRDADRGEMGFEQVDAILDGKTPVNSIDVDAGCLVFFRGRNALHRVVPNAGDLTRMLAVLAYNAEPGISLSESARMTFYGRLT